MYRTVDDVMRELVKDPSTYEKDEKMKTVHLTEPGSEKVEDMLREAGIITEGNLYDIFNVSVVHHVQQSLRAHTLFALDVDYIVRGDKVVIIDEFTGRMMEGRRYSEGLHQALEAKEHVTVQQENQTLATITFQNYFRLFPKLAGMTGTAMTEADEFMEIYKLSVVEVPTNVPVVREDGDDEVYRTNGEKFEAVAALIEDARKRGQPVLVGTVSIEKSELLSALLNKRGVGHSVLNARFHEQEASIIAQAGAPYAVTIATNMAGRGTDIKLGGNVEMRLRRELDPAASPEARAAREQAIRKEMAEHHEQVKQAGGLLVVGTERHESRRIDNQLRGRSGRQGDPGASRFFLSLEDDLMRIFGSERMGGMLQRLGLKEGEAIIHPWINRALEKAQKKVEARNFDTRKNLLKYDDVMNDQRREVYAQRREFMTSSDVSQTVAEMRQEIVEGMVALRVPERAFAEQWQTEDLQADVKRVFNLDLPIVAWGREDGIDETGLRERISGAVEQAAAEKAQKFGPEVIRFIEKSLLLQVFDTVWKEHLLALDHLRQGIGLRAYGQRDPLNEYKSEAFALFNTMLDDMRERVCAMLSRVELSAEPPPLPQPAFGRMVENHPEAMLGGGVAVAEMEPIQMTMGAPPVVDLQDPSTWGGISRNAPCPCGSGKKFKHCHGRMA
jgi:preprotein translocase subunit SecA